MTRHHLIRLAAALAIVAGAASLAHAQRFQPHGYGLRYVGAAPRFAMTGRPGTMPIMQQARRNPAPPAAAQRNAQGNGNRNAANNGARAPKGEHLAEWMNAHRNLTPDQQQRALENEPGFRELPQATQQRMRDRLTQLNAMTPQRRQQIIERNEHMEALTPDQRGQVRGALQQLGSLPPDQRRMVARSFRELRDLPQDQRMSVMGRYPLNDAQRATLTNLLHVEPLLPPPEKQ